MKKTFKYTLAASLALQAVAPMALAITAGKSDNVIHEESTVSDKKLLAATVDTQKLALQVLIAATILDSKGYEFVAVNDEIIKKYGTYKASFLGAVPTSIAGSAAIYTTGEFLKTVESVLAPITALLRGIYSVLQVSSTHLETVLTFLKVDKALELSVDSSKQTYTLLIEPVIKLLITKNTAISSASSAAVGTAGTSSFLLMNDAKEAMTTAQVRSLLGQDDLIKSRINQAADSTADIFNLSSQEKDVLKIAIYDNILEQAIKNKFSSDASLYKLDVLEILVSKNLISVATADAAKKLRGIANGDIVSEKSQEEVRTLLLQNLDATLALAAVIEQQLNSGKVTDKVLAAELQRMLGSLTAKLALIGFNLKQ